MRKKIALGILLLAFAFAVFLVYRIYAGAVARREIARRIEVLQEFSFDTLEGKPFNHTDLPNDMPMALLYFNTDCPHCRAELDDILRHPTLLDSVYFLMISRQKPERLSQFVHEKKLLSWENVVVLTDARNFFPKIFGTAMVPTLFIYGKDWRLVKIFKGEASAKAVYKAIFTNR